MARQAHIVSFEDAKAASSFRRAQTARRGREGDTARSRKADYFNSWKPATAIREVDDFDHDDDNLPSRAARNARASRGAVLRDILSGPADQSRNAASGRQAGPERRQNAMQSLDERRELKRRQRRKERADHLFDEQVQSAGGAGLSRSGSDESSTPRAALYEGKMGSTHRKSARMQRASTAQPESAKLNPAGWFSNIRVSRGSLRAGTALLCVVLAAVFLYVPAQQYYQALRQHDKLEAEYAVLEQRNDNLDAQNEALSSNAGMEDAVRQKYGYVVPGDEVAVVTGLSDHATDSSRDYENIEANVLSSTVKAPEEWYTPYLDAFFGVE